MLSKLRREALRVIAVGTGTFGQTVRLLVTGRWADDLMSAMRPLALAFLRLVEHRGAERCQGFGHYGRLLVRGRRKDQFAEALGHHGDHFGEVGGLRTGRNILVDKLVDLTVQAFGPDAFPRKLARLPACNIGGPALIHYCA